MSRAGRRRLAAPLLALTVLMLSACGGSSTARHSLPATSRASPSPGDAATLLFQHMTDEQRIGQLIMVGLSSDAGSATLTDAIENHHVGNVILYGSAWNSADKVGAAAATLQGMATGPATAGVRLYIGGNQEGGEKGSFQAFYGPGFQDMPSALAQGALDPAQLQSQATAWGKELAAAGINLDLAPVLDTVPAGTEAENQPIGIYGREYGHDPDSVAAHGTAFIRGMAPQVTVAEKHYPGLGRVQGNTDFTGDDIVDNATTVADPFLRPFSLGWQSGAAMVMVSLARYSRLDADNPAVFSSNIITALLRTEEGFQGVVISDDLGAAAAVQAVAPGDRAIRFIEAGGDIVLTVRESDVVPMTGAIRSRMHSDQGFRSHVYTSVKRVLRAKQAARMLS
jgi:beta-N-acetylhexosaminidase